MEKKTNKDKTVMTTHEVGVLIEGLRSDFRVFGDKLSFIKDKVEVIETNQAKAWEKITEIDLRLIKVEKEITKINDRLVGIENRLTKVEDKLTLHLETSHT